LFEGFEIHFYLQNVNVGKWINYYIFPVIENPSNLERIRFRDDLKIYCKKEFKAQQTLKK